MRPKLNEDPRPKPMRSRNKVRLALSSRERPQCSWLEIISTNLNYEPVVCCKDRGGADDEKGRGCWYHRWDIEQDFHVPLVIQIKKWDEGNGEGGEPGEPNDSPTHHHQDHPTRFHSCAVCNMQLFIQIQRKGSQALPFSEPVSVWDYHFLSPKFHHFVIRQAKSSQSLAACKIQVFWSNFLVGSESTWDVTTFVV